MKKILFLIQDDSDLKKNPEYLYDRFVKMTLTKESIPSDIFKINDINDIQSRIREYNPTHVVVPALWIEPATFKEIHNASPGIVWIVRVPKTETAMATLNNSVSDLNEYTQLDNVKVSCNANKELVEIIRDQLEELNDSWTQDDLNDKITSCDIVLDIFLK